MRAQNALFGSPRDSFAVEGIDYEPLQVRPGGIDKLENSDGEPLAGLRLVYMGEVRDTQWLSHAADEIARFLAANHRIEGREVTPRDIAVLTRTNRQAQDLQALLRRLGIPAVMHGDRSVLEAPEALELRRVLRALAEPNHPALLRTALATRLIGLDAGQLVALERDFDALELWTGRLRRWGELWRTFGVARAFEALLAETELAARTLLDRDGERRMTNFRHLLELLHEAETTEHLGSFGLMRWLEGAIADPSGHAMAAEARQLRLESDADAVTLTTGHKSKGLEYNIVFLPTLGGADSSFGEEAFRFFDPEAQASRFEMRGSEARAASKELYDRESRQESLRLGYVALTRAKHQVVALCGEVKSFSSLNYLLHEREAGGAGGIDDLRARLKKIGEEARLSELRELVARSEGAVEVSMLEPGRGPQYETAVAQSSLSEPAELPVLQERERTSSFSAMTRDAHGGLSRAAREGRDVDEHTDLDGAEKETAQPSAASARSAIADFPRGARPGDALHAMFEFSPFAEGDAQIRREVVERELSKRGFEAPHREMAAVGLEDVLASRFEARELGSEISLGELTQVMKRPEMEFSLPVGPKGARLSVAGLARVLGYQEAPPNAPELKQSVQQADADYLTPDYLSSLGHLSFDTWSGFLRGFIDLVYEWEGRLFVVDYKSNYLGEFYGDYTRSHMQTAMEEHHYLLQALLYSVAIHRYGKSRIPGYTYDSHFGGVQYLFLRGMHPDYPGHGVYGFRPSVGLLEKLSLLLDGDVTAGTTGQARGEA